MKFDSSFLEKKNTKFEKSFSLGIQSCEMQRDELISGHCQKTKLLPSTNNCKVLVFAKFCWLWSHPDHCRQLQFLKKAEVKTSDQLSDFLMC